MLTGIFHLAHHFLEVMKPPQALFTPVTALLELPQLSVGTFL